MEHALRSPSHRHQLRELLEAPIRSPRGTLRSLRDGGAVQAGKTGTASSTARPTLHRRPYQQARLALTYQAMDQTVALSVFAGPGAQPLS